MNSELKQPENPPFSVRVRTFAADWLPLPLLLVTVGIVVYVTYRAMKFVLQWVVEVLIGFHPLAPFGVTIAALAIVVPYAVRGNMKRRRVKSRIGHACVRCGYDMADKLHGTCPECGLVWATNRRKDGWKPSGCAVRSARPDEYGVNGPIWQLHTDSYGGIAAPALVELLHTSAGDAAISLVAEWDGKPAGYILLVPSVVRLDQPNHAEPEATEVLILVDFAVAGGHMGMGIGSALVIAGLREGMTRGYRRVATDCRPHFLLRFGFEPASKRGIRLPYSDCEDEDNIGWVALELVPGGLDDCAGVIEYPPRGIGT